MGNILPFQSALLFVLLASVSMAKAREPVSRNLFLLESPRDEVRPVYVAGEMATVLRFQQPCDRARTKMMGWEGRFEPVECAGKSVLIVPLKDLEPEDRFLLLVTLADGTELPFTVTARDERFDHQVNVFPDEKSREALQSRLEHTRARNQLLEEENGRLRSEETSVDHALAALLVKDATKMTPFRSVLVQLVKNPHGVEFLVTVLTSKKNNKIAVIFDVTNNSSVDAWRLLEARLATESGREKKPFALRASREYWGPGGESGRVAVVLDGSAFDASKGSDRLVLELFRRGDGMRQAGVFLERSLLLE
jgi:uncharacterized protein (TIGR02268 family)